MSIHIYTFINVPHTCVCARTPHVQTGMSPLSNSLTGRHCVHSTRYSSRPQEKNTMPGDMSTIVIQITNWSKSKGERNVAVRVRHERLPCSSNISTVFKCIFPIRSSLSMCPTSVISNFETYKSVIIIVFECLMIL